MERLFTPAAEPAVRLQLGFCHRLSAGNSCAFHAHAGLEIVYHPTGRGITRWRDRSAGPIAFGPGSVVVYPPACSHNQHMEEAGEDWCIQMAVSCGCGLRNRALHLPSVRNPFVIREIQELSAAPPPATAAERAVADCRAATLLAALQAELDAGAAAAAAPAGERYVHEAQRLISSRLESPFQVGDAARIIGVSSDYLRHLFRSRTGLSLKEWQQQARLRRAAELLHHSQMPLKAVAAACGFSNARHFSMTFHKGMGLTPGAWRRRQSQNMEGADE